MDVETLYQKHSAALLRFVRSRVDNQADAEDICTEVWLQAVKQTFDDVSPHSWLYAVARNRIIDRHRYERRHQTDAINEGSAATELPELSHSIDRRLLLLLTPAQRRVIELRFLHDQSLLDIAAQLNTTVGAVKALQNRALERLREFTERPAPPSHRIDHARAWTADDDERLRLGIEQGWPNKRIGAWLNRTPTAIKVRAKRLGIRRRALPTVATAADVATMLGARCAKTVIRWARSGWIPMQRSSQQRGAVWRFRWADVWVFCQNPAYWMAWDPARIRDPARRTWAIALRANQPYWLTSGEVAKRYHVAQNVVASWIAKGELPATRYGNYWIWSADLDAWVPPGERTRKPRRLTPDPGWLGTRAVAARYGVARGQPGRWIEAGLLPAKRVGRYWWVRESDLVGFAPPGSGVTCNRQTTTPHNLSHSAP